MPKFLQLNLQFFSADTGAGDGGNPEQSQGQSQAGDNPDPQTGQGSHTADGQQGNDGSQQNNEHFIPKSRFDEVNQTMKDLQTKLEAIEKEKQTKELEDKKKKGEFEELYTNAQTELETYKTSSQQTSQRVEVLEGIIQTLVDAELEAVPEDMRDLVPENFTAEQKLSWITTAKKKGLFGTANTKENEELGGSTNQQPEQEQEVGKMSVSQLFKSAYGKK